MRIIERILRYFTKLLADGMCAEMSFRLGRKDEQIAALNEELALERKMFHDFVNRSVQMPVDTHEMYSRDKDGNWTKNTTFTKYRFIPGKWVKDE